MRRVDVLKFLVQLRPDDLIICNIGDPSRELCSVRDAPHQFYMLGSMGLASSIGLGLALSRPGRGVVAVDGDGAVLMNLGSLATLADQAPEGYLLLIIDNGVYGSTGGQPTCASRSADLASIARGAGIRPVEVVSDEAGLERALGSQRSGVLVAKVSPESAGGPVVDLAPRQIIDRFMAECRRPCR